MPAVTGVKVAYVGTKAASRLYSGGKLLWPPATTVPPQTSNEFKRRDLLGISTGFRSRLPWNSGVNPAGRDGTGNWEQANDAVESQAGFLFDVRSGYQYQTRNVSAGAAAWNDLIGMQVLDWIDPYCPAVLGMKPFPEGGSYTAAKNGDYDTYLVKIGQTIAQKRPVGTAKVILRLAWELNYINDGTGARATDYQAGTRRIIDKIREGAGDRVRFSWCVTANTNNLTELQSMYWGDAYADLIAVDTYDSRFGGSIRGYHSEADWLALTGVGDVYSWAVSRGKLFAFDEWGGHATGAAGSGGDNPDWITVVTGWLRKNADNIAYEVSFNDTADNNVENNLWTFNGQGIQLPKQRAQFISSYAALRT
jgi:hypothetical protein